MPIDDSSHAEFDFVSRGGIKLAGALEDLSIDPVGRVCADLGCNVGGFTDCLLRRGAARVFAVDTGYGTLAWKLRKDGRVAVLERTNALHVELPAPVELVVIDVGWTRQHVILPVARKLLSPGGQIITLIKPHYESEARHLRRGVLPEEKAEDAVQEVHKRIESIGLRIVQIVESRIRGQKGNREFFALLTESAG